MIGLAAMAYEPLYHAREKATIKLSSCWSFETKSARPSNIPWLFLMKQLFHSHLLDMRWYAIRRCALRWLSIISYPTSVSAIIVKHWMVGLRSNTLGEAQTCAHRSYLLDVHFKNVLSLRGEQGWRSGESTHIVAWFDSWTRRHMWIEFVVGSRPCYKRFFSGYSGFPLSSKTNISKFQFDLESVPNLLTTLMLLCFTS